MGEIADAMLDGTLCEGCGCYMEGESMGFPRYCSPQCAGDRGATYLDDRYAPRVPRFNRYSIKPNALRANQVECPTCGKRVKKVGLKHHILDVHPDAASHPATPSEDI